MSSNYISKKQLTFQDNCIILLTMTTKTASDYFLKEKQLFRFQHAYIFILSFAILWCFLFISVPFLREGGTLSRKVLVFITLFFSPICHQIPSRSFQILGYPIAVCARCSGIYIGFLLGTIAYPFFKKLERLVLPSRWILIAGIFPMVLEISLSKMGVIHSNLYLIGASGFVIGSVMAFYVIPAVFQLINIQYKCEVNCYERKTR